MSSAEVTTPFSRDFRQRVRVHVKGYGEPRDALALAHYVAAVGLFVTAQFVQASLARQVAEAVSASVAVPSAVACLRALAWAGGSLCVLFVQVGSFIKLFMLNHDLMHGAFLSRRAWHWSLAVVAASLIFLSPTVWKREHDRHHRTSNDLDEPQDGQTASLTVAEYRALSPWRRRAYRVFNHPWLLFTVVPLGYFVVFMRLKARWQENLCVLALVLGLWRLDLFAAYFVPMTLAASLGFVIFHAQHTFDGVYRRRGTDWDYFENGMLGSSFLVLPNPPVVGRLLRFFAHGVQFHHAHHLNPGIPGYRLERCHAEAGSLFERCPRLTLWRVFATLHYNLYDEARGCFVDARRLEHDASMARKRELCEGH